MRCGAEACYCYLATRQLHTTEIRDLLQISFCKYAPLDTSLQSNSSLNMQTGKLPVDSLGTRDTDIRSNIFDGILVR